MKTFIIEESLVGYADITIEAETEEEDNRIAIVVAITKIVRMYIDDMFYDYEFQSITEEK